MKLISDDVDFDIVEATERADRWESVRIGMKLGMISPDNFSREDREAVRAFFARLPIIEATDARRGTGRVIGEAELREGWEWCFATSRDGVFGVFSSDESSRENLHGAVFHLWVRGSAIDPKKEVRLDFVDLGEYQSEALEAALAA